MTVRRSLCLLVLAGLAGAPSAAAKPSALQTTFRTALLADAKTTSAVKRALRSGSAFVDPKPLFGDVTGDGKSDAVVSVVTGGAAGAVALYVFSTDGAADGKLRAIFRSQALYRAAAELEPEGTLVLRTPSYAEGDLLCCPAKVRERTYAWVAKAHELRPKGAARVTPGPSARR
jgi:hypothetical protein